MLVCGACGLQLPGEARFCFRCGQPVAAAAVPGADPLIGVTLGSYRIVSILGEGGMGKVYRAEQTNLGRAVVVKTLLPHLAGDAAVVARFEREAKVVSGLRHPNIVQVLDFGRAKDGLLYIVMELVEGGTLRRVIERDAPVAVERALSLVEQVASALEEAHGSALVHRDLKPENVLLGRLRDGSDIVKVTDFGIARTLDQDTSQRLTATGMVAGTPGYMAPEQIMGAPPDARIDVYAMGVIFFELLTGKALFEAPNVAQLLQRHLNEPAPSPSKVSGLPLPPAIDQLVLRCLERAPERRFSSALDVKRAVEASRAVLKGGRTGTLPTAQPSSSPGATQQLPTGASLAAAPGAGPEVEALRRLMPSRLLEHLEELPTVLGGEKRTVTVVFGDISGFTAMSETMDPEDVRLVMNRCFDGMVEAVARYDGTVDKFIGDAIMVLFGAPKSHEDDPERAVRCALDMQAHLAEVNKTLARPVGMRIGVNTGEVVAGGVGGLKRMDYTVMGDVVNTAQRLEGKARVGGILVSAALQRLTERAVRYRKLEPITVKGKKEPLEVYEVEGLAGAGAALSELVGRDAEVQVVEALFGRVKAGRAGGVLFLGDAGLGKTRLLDEAEGLAAKHGLAVARGSAGRWGAPLPFELAKAALFSLCGGLPKDLADADARLAGLSKLGVEEAEVRRLQHLFGTASAASSLDAEESQRQLRAAVVQAFFQAGSKAGLCLLLDDLHLADRPSLEVLDEVLVRAKDAQLALVATARPGDTDRLLPRVARRELSPLEPRDVVRLARLELKDAELPPSAEKLLVARTEGNPFYTRELVRLLIQEGGIQLRGGTWTAMPALDALALPESVGLLVQARLDALSAGARLLLRTASVVGRVFPLDLVAAAIDTPIDLQLALHECTNHGVLAAVPSPPGCWQFAQAMVHDTVFRAITRPDRRNVHARLAEALEHGAGAGGDHPAVLMARHFLGAEQYRKAIRYMGVAGERLAARGAHDEAAELFTQALGIAAKDILKGAVTTEDSAQYLLGLSGKAVQERAFAAPDKAVAAADEALARVPTHLAARERAEVLRQKGAALLKLSRPEAAEEALNEALKYLAGAEAGDARAAVLAEVAAAREAKGDLPGAATLLMQGFQDIAQAGARALVWRYLNQLGRIHLRLKQPAKAREFFENARAQARASADLVGEAKALANLAGSLAAQGDVQAALAQYAQALELAAKAGDRVGAARVHYNVGRLLLTSGSAAEGAERLELALKQAHELGWREGIAAASQALEACRAQRR